MGIKKKVVIDPGHCGQDNGVIGFLNGKIIAEKDIALQVGLKVKEFLFIYYGLKQEVVLTREDDSFINVYKRAEIINSLKAHASVTIHLKSSPNIKDSGFTTYVHVNHSPDSEKLLENIHKEMILISKAHGITNDRGMRSNKEKLLELTNLPTIQVCLGYLSNPSDIQILTRVEYQEDIAKAIGTGIANYLELTPIKNIPETKPQTPIKIKESIPSVLNPNAQTQGGLPVTTEVGSVAPRKPVPLNKVNEKPSISTSMENKKGEEIIPPPKEKSNWLKKFLGK